jgi:glycosyltransferase involved in cell wall biosynthesis
MPRVSIVIPTYNLAQYIGRTLATVFGQTYSDYEVIVADDGSTDDTQNVLSPWDGKILYLYQSNRGVAAARNLALSKASGEFIAYVDADDMWYPQKLQRQVSFLDAHQEYGLVHSEFSIVDESDQIIHARFNQDTDREVPRGSCAMDLLRRNHIQPLTVMERHECIQRTGGFDVRLKGVDDYLRWILLALDGIAIGYVDEPLAMYRWRGDRFSVKKYRTYRQAFANLYTILLREKPLALSCGQAGVDIISAKLYDIQRELAYLERADGDLNLARRRILGLIRETPLRAELYLDLLKSVVPFGIAERIRRFRSRDDVKKRLSPAADAESGGIS